MTAADEVPRSEEEEKEEDVLAAEAPFTFPEEALQLILKGSSEAEVLLNRGEGVPSQGTAAWDRFQEAVRQGCSIRDLLLRNTEELEGVLKALNGEFVPPAPGGDLLRDGSGVLPTGRNIHALDPYRIPSKIAMARGKAAAELSISLHRKDNNDEFPETIAVNLWGLEAIKTRGESVGIVLGLVGAEPVSEATGRVVRFDLIPLEKLGRPRVDVLTSLSGIFR